MSESTFTFLYLFCLAAGAILWNIYKNRHQLQLIKRVYVGHLMVNLPVLLLLFGLSALPVLFVDTISWRIGLILMAIIVALSLAWINWSLLIPKWRKWAFQDLNEDELLELERLAIAQALIWPAGHTFEQTELPKAEDKPILLDIAARIVHSRSVDEIGLALKLGKEKRYGFNRRMMWVELIAKLFIVLVMLASFFISNVWVGLVLLISILLIGDNKELYRNVRGKHSYLLVSQTGMVIRQSALTQLNWGELDSVCLLPLEQELKINRLCGEVMVWKLDMFTINYPELWSVLNIYIDRYAARREALAGSLN